MQNDMLTAVIWSKSKLDVEFQYGGRLGEFNGMSSHSRLPHCMAVWLTGNALTLINVAALRQTWLLPGWVTVCGRVNHLGM